MKLTIEEKQVKIAKACGWTQLQPYRFEDVDTKAPVVRLKGYHAATSRADKWVPDYDTDLNAMHEAEKSLTKEQRIDYLENLNDLTGSYADACFASSQNRFEALGQTFKLWEAYPQIRQAIRDWQKAEREATAVINAAVANHEEFGR